MAVALFLVPALIDRLKIVQHQNKKTKTVRQRIRLYTYLIKPYSKICQILYRWKKTIIALLILAFGIPVFMLPEKLEEKHRLATLYNQTLGSEYYKENIASTVNKILGGSLRLFVQNVYNGSYFGEQGETTLSVNASLPSHSTLAEMNNLIQRMESYLSQYAEIKQFQTQIHNSRRANITIQFVKKHAKGGFPHQLKSNLISKSLEMGGGSWSVYGVGDGFSNDVRENAGSYRIEMYGYNYDELYSQATVFKDRLLENRRIKEVNISSEFSWFKDNYEEYIFHINKRKLAEENIQPYEIFQQLSKVLAKDIRAGTQRNSEGEIPIYLSAKQAETYDVWNLLNAPIHANQRVYKVTDLAEIKKEMLPQEVAKVDQQYRLCLQYEYIGAAEQGKRVLESEVDKFEPTLPIGYSIKSLNTGFSWGDVSSKQYMLLLMIFVIIYFIAAILFNSLKQPLYILSVVPISFIGIFLSFYLFRINFDQGGFASFILLSGLTINANIYIINEYNIIKKKYPKLPKSRVYMQAWNSKVKPISLTVLSTILGFIPFLIGETKEGFWFPLAVGTIGGLIIATMATFLFLPFFMGITRKNKMMTNKALDKKNIRLKKCLFIIFSIGLMSIGCKKKDEKIDWNFLYEQNYSQENIQLAHKFIEQLEQQFYKMYSLKNGLSNTEGQKIDIDYSDFDSDSSLLSYLNQGNLSFASTPHEDKDLITTAEIAQEIKQALKLRERYTWAKKVPDEIYINYVMPYKIDHELPHNWKTFFYEKQQQMLDSLERTDDNTVENAAQLIADNIYSWYYYDEGHIPRSQYPTLSEILFSGKGDCFRISRLFVYAMRAAGIPAAVDDVPYWGSKNGSHSDFVSLDSTGKLRTNVTTLHKNFLRKTAKVLRRTAFYQGNYSEGYASFGVQNDPHFPPFLKNDFFIDVTEEHTQAFDLKYDLPETQKNSPYAYICVYNYGEWKPIYIAKNKGGIVTFPKMTADVLYRIATVKSGKLDVFSEVIYQDENGIFHKIKPDLKNKQKITINKYNDGAEAYISPNDRYALYYITSDGNWKKLSTESSQEDYLNFYNVPSKTLYKVVNESKRTRNLERPFQSIENTMVWW